MSFSHSWIPSRIPQLCHLSLHCLWQFLKTVLASDDLDSLEEYCQVSYRMSLHLSMFGIFLMIILELQVSRWMTTEAKCHSHITSRVYNTILTYQPWCSNLNALAETVLCAPQVSLPYCCFPALPILLLFGKQPLSRVHRWDWSCTSCKGECLCKLIRILQYRRFVSSLPFIYLFNHLYISLDSRVFILHFGLNPTLHYLFHCSNHPSFRVGTESHCYDPILCFLSAASF